MKLDRGPVPIDMARELVEEALAVASRSADPDLRRAFHEDREAVQSIEIVDIREKRLDALDSLWMEKLRVSDAVERLLSRQPDVHDLISKCFLRLARARADERAFLSEDDPHAANDARARPALVVHLTVDTLLASERLEPLVMTTLASARRSS